MTATPNRWEVNAAIGHLISGSDEGWLESARIVVGFGRTIPEGTHLVEKLHLARKPGESAAGYAQGYGNVTIQDRSIEEKESSSGAKVERIGNYKILHSGSNGILFCHYKQGLRWKDIDAVPVWYLLIYDHDGEPHTFAMPTWESARIPFSQAILDMGSFLRNMWYKCQGKRVRVWKQKTHYVMVGYSVIHSTRPELNPGDIV